MFHNLKYINLLQHDQASVHVQVFFSGLYVAIESGLQGWRQACPLFPTMLTPSVKT